MLRFDFVLLCFGLSPLVLQHKKLEIYYFLRIHLTSLFYLQIFIAENYYELLGIGRDSSLEEIKSAYQSMVNKYQPDNIKGENLNKILSSLDEARDVLLDSNKKREYDEFLDQ